MTAVDVTIIDQIRSEGSKRELVTRLSDLLNSLDRDHQPGGRMRWRVIPQAMRSEIVPSCEQTGASPVSTMRPGTHMWLGPDVGCRSAAAGEPRRQRPGRKV